MRGSTSFSLGTLDLQKLAKSAGLAVAGALCAWGISTLAPAIEESGMTGGVILTAAVTWGCNFFRKLVTDTTATP